MTAAPKILDMLDSENVKAAFFLTGSTVESGGEVAVELVKRGKNKLPLFNSKKLKF